MSLYKNVPKTFRENLAYRSNVLRRCQADKGFRRAMLAASKQDVLLWLNLFAWLYEPRPRFGSDGKLLPKIIPCITWPHQDPVILDIDKNLGLNDIGIEKARGEGMSWLSLLLALRDWLFDPGAKIGLVSNTEKKADDPGNMDSLLAKIDWELTKLPKWMAGIKDQDYKRNLNDHSLVNLRNMSQINAFAATSDAGRAGRYKWFLADELAFWERGVDSQFMTSVRSSTDCRLVVSTPNGSDGEYYSFMHTPSGSTVRLTLDWKDNPTRNRGLYELIDGRPVAIDPVNNPLLPGYDPPDEDVRALFERLLRRGFKLDKRIRSPWYDRECDRSDSTPQTIAQELDRDYGGSTYRVFGADFMDEAKRGVLNPMVQGDLSYHPETLTPLFDRQDKGPLLLWCKLDHRNRPPVKQYAIGADVAAGLAGSFTSNSVVSVVDVESREQVAEFATNNMAPSDFADFCVSLAKWFHDAYLAWEANGPGAAFGKRVIDKGYGNVYYRTSHWKRGKGRKSREIGWWSDPKSKEALFGELLRSVRSGEVRPRSKDLVDEFPQYVRINGRIEHVLTAKADESSKGQAHGDRVIAFGVTLQAVLDRPLPSQKLSKTLEDDPPPQTIAYRQKQYEDSLKDKDGDGWDFRTNDDIAGGEGFRRIAE